MKHLALVLDHLDNGLLISLPEVQIVAQRSLSLKL